jgi:cell wall-associated NlpC family hydrolase
MKIIIYTAALAAALTANATNVPYFAVVTSPVADLLFQPMNELKNHYKKGYSYDQIAISCKTEGHSLYACPRAHQLRANDLVKVLEETQDEVKIHVPSFFYLRKDTTIAQQNYWMRKKDIIALKDLPCCTPEQPCIPKPIVINTPIPHSVTLAQPWYNNTTHTLFSAGTRFASSGSDELNYHIFVFDPSLKRYVAALCPIEECVETPGAHLKDRRTQMIALIRSWITDEDEDTFIPYAFGGSSIVKKVHSKRAAHEHKVHLANGEPAICYEWPGVKHQTPKTGIDCSGLILLAAHSTGIPYFCKNSYTALTTLRPVSAEEPLEVGDVIWVRGHVMLVADLENNTLIEARGYEHGYGKLQEIPISEQFKGIKTYQELIARYQNNQSIERIDKDGNVRDIVHIKLLKLA